ncbi:hypothetical protein [Sulfobacillus thermosulfidooxidans]|uniref:hypothetical protein n=1 Tax=Sulfobacillus thermosulfidooxidans TaxID=28034 RepID=UPI0019D7177A|nr:hypothetical protein [Sulfobacillus thermosulfidooxidans]
MEYHRVINVIGAQQIYQLTEVLEIKGATRRGQPPDENPLVIEPLPPVSLNATIAQWVA